MLLNRSQQRFGGSSPNFLKYVNEVGEESTTPGEEPKKTTRRGGATSKKGPVILTLSIFGLVLLSINALFSPPSSAKNVLATTVDETRLRSPETNLATKAEFALSYLVDRVGHAVDIMVEKEGLLVKDNCYFADGVTRFDSKDTPRAEVTVVTGYFEMPNKHSSNEFNEWISNFMQIESFVLAFTNSEKTAELLKSKRPEHLHKQMVICKMSLEDTVAFKKYGPDGMQAQISKDPEASLHRSYTLYLVWLGKPEFVLKAIDINPFGSEYFLWNDVGTFRNKFVIGRQVKTWPDPEKVRHVCGKGVVSLISMNPSMPNEYCGWGDFTTPEAFKQDKRLYLGQNPSVYTVSGSQFCGSADAFKPYADAFQRVMDIMHQANVFIGKDQTVMAQVAMTRPDIVRLVQEKTDGWRDWFLFTDALRKNGTDGPNPQYTFESCLTRPYKQIQ